MTCATHILDVLLTEMRQLRAEVGQYRQTMLEGMAMMREPMTINYEPSVDTFWEALRRCGHQKDTDHIVMFSRVDVKRALDMLHAKGGE